MVEETDSPTKARDIARLFLGMIFGAIFVLFGESYLSSAARPVKGIERTGTVIDASDSRGRHGNNTTLVFEDRYGERESFEVKSSIKLREVGRIRQRVRALKGEDVIYTVAFPSNDLLSVRTVGGEDIVTREHILAAKLFTGWSMTILGFTVMFICFVCIAHLERKKK